MDEETIKKRTRGECIEKLMQISQHGLETLHDLKMKLGKIFLY